MGDVEACGIHHYRTIQGSQCPRFTPPPLDGQLYMAEWLDWHIDKSRDHPYCVLVGDNDEDNVTVTWQEFGLAVHRLASHFLRAIQSPPNHSKGRPETVAVLFQAGQLVYATIVMALIRAGFEPFCLSPRNSLAALEHLVNRTDCAILIGSARDAGQQGSALQETTAELLGACTDMKLVEVPSFSQIYPRLCSQPIEPYDAKQDVSNTELVPPVRSLHSYQQADPNYQPVYMLHSSGSTNFPKPIRIPSQSVLAWARWLWYGDVDVAGTIWSCESLPVFHAAGIAMSLVLTASSGLILAAHRPSDTPRQLTSEGIFHVAKRAHADYVISVPSICEALSESSEAMEFLASMKGGLVYTGGPLIQEKGERLAARGVQIQNVYGSTESALISKGMNSRRLSGITDWPYIEISPELVYQLEPEGDCLHRPVILNSSPHHISGPSNLDYPTHFDTNDLLEEHPTHKGFWKVVGRADDQIMMSNGEKTNPGPLESLIAGHPMLKAAVMFGRARTQVGVAVEPAVPVNIHDDDEVARFRNAVWPAIEKANTFAPSHSRVFKEMILVIDPSVKPFARTGKNTLARHAVLKQYAEEIDAIYEAAERPLIAEWANPPVKWDTLAIRDFISRVVNGVMKARLFRQGTIDESRDLFEQGCDSLQATYIRNAIINALQHVPTQRNTQATNAHLKVPPSLVFAYPTILQLAGFVSGLVSGDIDDSSSVTSQKESRIAAMLAMVKKYASDMPDVRVGKAASKTAGEAVLVTGTTGTLGSYLLQTLLLDPKVYRVYALNRLDDSASLLVRQQAAFKDRGVDVELLSSPKLRLLEGDASLAGRDLDARVTEEIRGCLTTVVHNAWRLDFNLSLSSFESHVKATRNLVDLALSLTTATPQFIFTSSIGTLSNWDKTKSVPEEPIADPQVPLGIGYGESKWVAERLLVAAAQERGLRTTIWRVGQLAGSTVNGMWNTTDWVPIMAKSGKVMGALPSSPGANVSWLPTDKAAATIVEALHVHAQTSNTLNYVHLVHPNPTKWDIVLGAIAKRLEARLIPFADWFALLEAAEKGPASEMERNPAIKLLDFFRTGASGVSTDEGSSTTPTEGMGLAVLETEQALRASQTLAHLEPLTEKDVRSWMTYWETRGLFAE